MPNGDVVSGCSDGIVRIFSEVEERWASAEELKAHDESVASQALPSQQLGGLNKEQLQDVDGLATPGALTVLKCLSRCSPNSGVKGKKMARLK